MQLDLRKSDEDLIDAHTHIRGGEHLRTVSVEHNAKAGTLSVAVNGNTIFSIRDCGGKVIIHTRG